MSLNIRDSEALLQAVRILIGYLKIQQNVFKFYRGLNKLGLILAIQEVRRWLEEYHQALRRL